MRVSLLRVLIASCWALGAVAASDLGSDLLLVHDTVRRVSSGHTLRFKVNSELATERTALRIELYSLAGDVDLYLGPHDDTRDVSFENYAFKSATFGREVIDLPASFPRPLVIAVFAAEPVVGDAEFRLRVFLDRAASTDEYDRVRLASQADGRSYEECAGGISGGGGATRDTSKAKTTLPPPPQLEEKSSWLLTLLFHFLELVVEVLL